MIAEVQQQLVDNNLSVFERNVMAVLIGRQVFYRRVKGKLCPPFPEGGRRNDFSVRRYNILFEAIAAYWDLIDGRDHPNPIPRPALEFYLRDWARASRVPGDIIDELLAEFDAIYAIPMVPAFIEAMTGPLFQYWFNVRLTKGLAEKVGYIGKNYTVTFDAIDQVVEEGRKGLFSETRRIINACELMRQQIAIVPKLGCSLKGLNHVLGGGFGFGETTVIAGVNAGGKTVMACQLAYDFAKQGRKVVYVSTEQRPVELFCRIASNHLNVEYNHFTSRREIEHLVDAGQEPTPTCVPVVPEWVRTDPVKGPLLDALGTIVKDRLVFLDWSNGQGMNIPTHLESEIEGIEGEGRVPDAIILDWIGGGLDTTLQGRLDLRHIYQQAADFLINYGKRKNRVIVVLAQLDRVKAIGKQRCGASMLSECKTLVNNATNFVGISAVMDPSQGSRVFAVNQYLYAEKSRHGTGGVVPVERQFRFQRFLDKSQTGGFGDQGPSISTTIR